MKILVINCHCDNHSNNLLLEKNKFDLIKDFSDDKVMEIGFNFINSFEVLEEYEKDLTQRCKSENFIIEEGTTTMNELLSVSRTYSGPGGLICLRLH